MTTGESSVLQGLAEHFITNSMTLYVKISKALVSSSFFFFQTFCVKGSLSFLQNLKLYAISDVLTAPLLNFQVFWDVTPCRLVSR